MGGTASSRCQVKVNTKPCCDDMDDQEAFEGDDFTFQVDCDGSPKPVAKWTKDGKVIDTKDGHFTIMQADPNAYRLIIKGVKAEDDAGEYQVEFSNRAGDKKCSAQLTVHSLEELKVPKCMSDLKSKKAQKGGKTFFNIKIRAEQLPEVKWFMNDVEIVKDDHCGKIKVVAKNENGEDAKEADLEVQFAPE